MTIMHLALRRDADILVKFSQQTSLGWSKRGRMSEDKCEARIQRWMPRSEIISGGYHATANFGALITLKKK
jgi:hypothetical protein